MGTLVQDDAGALPGIWNTPPKKGCPWALPQKILTFKHCFNTILNIKIVSEKFASLSITVESNALFIIDSIKWLTNETLHLTVRNVCKLEVRFRKGIRT